MVIKLQDKFWDTLIVIVTMIVNKSIKNTIKKFVQKCSTMSKKDSEHRNASFFGLKKNILQFPKH